MKKVLILNFPAEGHVNPTLGITKAFADRGYDVHYIATEKYKERLEAVGATVHLHQDLLRTTPIQVASPNGILDFLKIHIKTSLDILHVVKELSKSIQFDFVYYDKFGAGELVRDYLNIPGISSSASFLFDEEHLKILPLHPDSEVPLQLDQECEDLLAEMKETYGVSPKNLVQFMNNKGELNVVYTSRYFQPESDRFGDECLFIGPSFPKRAAKTDFPVEQLKNEKVIYISMGTVLDKTEEFFNLCIDAFSNFAGIVVIAAGEKADLTKLKQAPENFIIAPYVPQLEVLEHSDVFITHGGMNSVNEGIHFNVPLVVMPHDKDQPMVAQRLSELQAGYTISKDEVNAQLLKQGIEEVLQNDQYLEGIKRINQSFQECMDMDEVMERIDQLIHQKTK
ncbi:UDP-glucosyltransferase [Bacillus halotolerans]|uniref:Glycosyltransferase n=2 Tax=Bacteria TaxID=2 RepID=A0ABY7I4E4_9BACI|nr:macrolide family glycosyltransferase [Bacillus halotolerans]MBV5123609.1 UDP-glucosyltransferase [Bacillus halotolerans]MCC2117310.1 UDP-glucosyltransferase [Bacillus halotolerans]UUI84928.1 UDP-glucosyltransferase [Bacillus halotolerans]UYO32654.1 UDP-glucosyltransferase [Bacillus halotolerans]WAT21980.1 glycosyltransferase [Bacillus halotolerans]